MLTVGYMYSVYTGASVEAPWKWKKMERKMKKIFIAEWYLVCAFHKGERMFESFESCGW
jgi:hypothetical protein